MIKNPMVSIVIPLQNIDGYVRETVSHLLRQKYPNFEIILLPNDPISRNPFGKHVKIIPLGNIQPAEKRNFGAKVSKGEILAFIDDDAYPADELWLSRAVQYFRESQELGAIGGPNFTPPEDGTFQVVCGEVLASWIFSGPASRRYKRGEKGEYNDLPSCNLFVRKKVFEKVGGFYPYFWPGEDTKLCADILRARKKILYDPEIDVYHHRRKGWESYIRQTFRFGLHRGYFMKLFPYTSLKPMFFIPSVFIIALLFGPWLGLIHEGFLYAYLGMVFLYGLLVLGAATTTKKFSTIPLFCIIGAATHIAYGIGVIVGLCKSPQYSQLKPKSEK